MIKIKNELKERCILVGVSLNTQENPNSLSELARLADTAGAEVAHTIHQNLAVAHPKFYIGKGKAEQIKRFADELGVNLVIFDDELTPAQTKNLQNLLNVKVVDRAALILDIFSKHARTKEAKTQIELAQLQYLLPRLSRMWLHLERQMGGIGARGGPGETQIEIDRRLVRDKIAKLKKDLKKSNCKDAPANPDEKMPF
ncbi:MAG: GTPase HflX [Candidatus Marinimicrobia bacterium]|nr:GTPase HflX [Candidatus Neomarinimicrobiota bacterium]